MAQLLSNLPVGAKVKFGKYSVNGETPQDIIWIVAAINHSNYPSNSVTLLTSQIIDLRAIDAIEPNNTDGNIQNNGNNNYGLSNIDQWLNKDTISWYVAAHATDQSPDNNYTLNGTGYDTRPGFLSNFTSVEKNSILTTSIPVTKYSYTTETISRRVFLLSATEVGVSPYDITDGSLLAYFSTQSRRCALTSQCYNYSLSSNKPASLTTYWGWWLRSAAYNWTYATHIIDNNGSWTSIPSCSGDYGIRPALNISSALSISDTTDGDGCYTFIWNAAPPNPAIVGVPTLYGGKTNLISWSTVTDPDGDTVTYTLECSIDSGEYTQIYSGTSTVYAHLIPFGTTSVTYRVKATDPSGASSEYTTAATMPVTNNNAPVIDGADANLGVKSEGFTGTYKVEDADSDTVTVTESIDGVQIRSLVATLGEEITYGVTENTWLALANGSHTLIIRATDGIDSTVRTYTFTKLVETLTIQNSTPWVSSTMPTRIMLVITRNIPSESTFKVEVCNNGYDTTPTWEDCTDAVKSGLVHVFTNAVKTAGSWGVLVKVTVARNGATGACYVSAIGGNFE